MEKVRPSSSTPQASAASSNASTAATAPATPEVEPRPRRLKADSAKSEPKVALPVAPEPEPAEAAEEAGDLQPFRDVPVDWEALEDAFENNAPEVHSYLQLATGEVIRVVDGVADPQMHARIAADAGYLRVDPVSSREQYRWMERFIPMVENLELRGRLNQAIDGKGAFRRFKDVLMAYAEERERWFTYRSERLKTFMDAWLTAHSLRAIARPAWTPVDVPGVPGVGPGGGEAPVAEAPMARERRRTPEALRRHIRDVIDGLGAGDLEAVASFAEFLRTRKAMRVARGESVEGEDESPASSTRAHEEPR
jgi:hypothetical protein